ncbi:MAG: FliM/FliN family flagellar motor C-terminal domain-containing protein [Arenibacterium sp.]
MSVSEKESTMQRKMAASMGKAANNGRSAVRCLRLSLARAARDVFELPLTVIGAKQGREPLETVTGLLSEDNLLMHLDGPAGAIGAMSVNRSFLTALIQQQTIGTITGGEPAERAFTNTDAALVAPLVDEALKRAADMSEKPADIACFKGFRFGTRVPDRRALALLLEAERFRYFELVAEFQDGVSQGEFLVVLPEPTLSPEKLKEKPETARMEDAIGNARADLNAVICRLKLSLHDLSNLQVGDTVALQEPNLSHADLLSISGAKICEARLGQAGGLRAVRINEAVQSVVEQPAEAQSFTPDALNAPQHVEDALTLDMEAVSDVTDPSEPWNEGLPDTLPELDGLGDNPMDFSDFPAMDTAMDEPLPDMNPQDAAVEISNLAGIDLEGEALPD